MLVHLSLFFLKLHLFILLLTTLNMIIMFHNIEKRFVVNICKKIHLVLFSIYCILGLILLLIL